jgi:Dolichyl-phosphate-mannose-protein mannosyltransferase
MATPPIDVSVRPPRPSPGPGTRPPRASRASERSGRRTHAPAPPPRLLGWRERAGRLSARHGAAASAVPLVTVPLVAAASGLLLRLSASDAPGRGRDEGVLVADAWALGRSLPEAASTMAPGRPTLATWQLATWDRVTGAFDRAPSGVAGGREAMAVALVASATLVWVLGRRLALPRWAALVGFAFAAASPLVVDLHRTVQPGVLATPWLLAAFALARTRHRAVTVAWAASGAALAVAVLSAPVVAVAAPAVAWQVRHTVRPSARARAIPTFVAGVLAVLVPGWLLVLDRGFALTGDGSLADLGGRVARPWGDVLATDPLAAGLLAVGALLAPVASRRFRPLAAAFWVLVVLALRADAPAVVLAVAVPLGAVLLGGAAEALWVWTSDVRRARRATTYLASRGVRIVDGLAPAALAAVALAGLVSVPLWVRDQATALAADDDAALRATVAWLDANMADETRLVVDESLWLDLVQRGTDPSDLTAYDGSFGSWRDYDYVVVPTPAAGATPAVAVFGERRHRVEVRRTRGESPAPAPPAPDPAAAGTALAGNPQLGFTPDADAALRTGQVDERVLTFLATVAVDHTAAVARFPLDPAEARAGAPARTVELVAVDGRPVRGGDAAVADVTSFLERQPEPWYQPARAEIAADPDGGAVLRVAFPPA